ncbi:DUF1622 domain-containing protein [Flavisolibacter tropicus]|nr:DUF1622 domain-containing protein [Flavisolibacter tropicus]
MDAVVTFLILVIKIISMLIIGWAALVLGYGFLKHQLTSHRSSLQEVRTHYVQALLLALEVLVAGGVLLTILHPSLNDIGKLAAIIVLRIVIKKSLNRSLQYKTGSF